MLPGTASELPDRGHIEFFKAETSRQHFVDQLEAFVLPGSTCPTARRVLHVLNVLNMPRVPHMLDALNALNVLNVLDVLDARAAVPTGARLPADAAGGPRLPLGVFWMWCVRQTPGKLGRP